MTRQDLASANRTETNSRLVREVAFLYIPFPSGTITISTDDSPHTFTDSASGLGALTFVPGGIASIENINENDTGAAERCTLTLGGCDSALISKCVNDAVHWLRVVIWLGYMDVTGALVTTPYRVFDGFLGSPTVQTGSNSSTIVVTAETLNAALARVSMVRGCDADQQARFAGDTLFHQVSVQGIRKIAFGNNIQWGGADNSGPATGPVSGTGSIGGGGGGGWSTPTPADPFVLPVRLY